MNEENRQPVQLRTNLLGRQGMAVLPNTGGYERCVEIVGMYWQTEGWFLLVQDSNGKIHDKQVKDVRITQ